MEYNFLKFSFSCLIFITIIGGGLINYFERYLPGIIIKSFRYGKFAYDKKVMGAVEVPRRWFKHFYVFAAIWSTIGLILATYVYLIAGKPIPLFNKFIDFSSTDHRTAQVNATSSYVALILLTVQSWKRFYETHFVNIFSNSTINLAHYLVGYFHYFGAVLAILAEAPGFSVSPEFNLSLSFDALSLKIILPSVVFLWATWNQLIAAQTLANLRKNKKGEVVTQKHSVPEGGLFEVVSSPHLMCEILMYACLTIILWGNVTWVYIFLWVLCNQVETAFLSHWWYQETFKNYPAKRAALIPYLL